MKPEGWKKISIILVALGIFFIALPMIVPAVSPSSLDTSVFQTTLNPLECSFSNMQQISIISAVDPNAMDQSQKVIDASILVSQSSSYNAIMQYVKNDREPLTGFSIVIGYTGPVTEPIYIGVMTSKKDPTNGNNYHAMGYVNPSSLEPETFYWMTMDLTGIPMSGTDCYIVMITNDVYSSGKYWAAAMSQNNPYSRGTLWVYAGGSWQSSAANDLAFVTYTTVSGGGGGVPSVAISFSWTIISYLAGLSSFCFAAVSGFKGFRVL